MGLQLHVLHLGKFYPPDAGGIESVTEYLAEGAADAGMRVTVVCFDRDGGLPADIVHKGVRLLRSKVVTELWSQPIGIGYCRAALSEGRVADVVHLHAPNPLAALLVPMLGRRPMVIVHWHSDIVGKGWLGRCVRPLEWAMLKRADAIVCTSRHYAESSNTLRGFSQKIRIVPIGTPDAFEDPVLISKSIPADLECRLLNRRIVLAVGRLVPYKGFDVLVEAAAAFPSDVVTLIVGSGPMQEELQSRIAERRLESRVILTGRLSAEALRSLFMRAALFCLPSVARSEAFGVVLVEAMSAALPIVATQIEGSGVPWVNVHGETGFNVPVRDPEALARAIIAILESSEMRERFSRAARVRFLEEFTVKASVSRMLAIYADPRDDQQVRHIKPSATD